MDIAVVSGQGVREKTREHGRRLEIDRRAHLPRFGDNLFDLDGNGALVGDSLHEFRREFDADRRRVLAHPHAREGSDLHAIRHPAYQISQYDAVRRRLRCYCQINDRLISYLSPLTSS